MDNKTPAFFNLIKIFRDYVKKTVATIFIKNIRLFYGKLNNDIAILHTRYSNYMVFW